MEETIVEFTHMANTKNTVKYEEKPPAGKDKVIGVLYVQKSFLGNSVPPKLKIKICIGEE